MFKLSGAELLYLFSAFHGVFLSILLLLNLKRLKVNIYLSLLILLFSFYLVENVVYSSGYLRAYPHFFLTTFPLIFLVGPLFYHYIKSNVQPDHRLRLVDLVHLIPFVAEVIILLPFYLLPADIKVKIYDASIANAYGFQFNIYFVGYLVYLGSTFWYFFHCFKLLSRVENVNGIKNQRKIRWLRSACISFFSYILINAIMTVVSSFDPGLRSAAFHVNLIFQTFLIHAIGYVAFIYPGIFSEPEEAVSKKYQSSSLDQAVISQLKSQLVDLLIQQEPFLDSEITPAFFAEKLGISKHQLSQLLTEGLETNFYDLINSHRVEKAKVLMLQPEYDQAKILHIAYDCGFSNKSSFLRNFKKITGLTPTEYRAKTIKRVPLH